MLNITSRKHDDSAPSASERAMSLWLSAEVVTLSWSRLKPRSVDLVCFPEMIFTGYVFPDATSILPYLEEPKTGPTSIFCSELASHLHCHVLAGYPERLRPDEVERGVTIQVESVPELGDDEEELEEMKDTRIDRVGANSAVLYGPDGKWVGGYRKTNLFKTDMTWAKPGTGLATFYLPPPLGTLTLGICMDLNPIQPATWSLEEGPYEVADHAVMTDSDTVVLLNAWLASSSADDNDGTSEDWQVVQYWAARLRPLWARKEGQGDGKEVLVVVCNRCGEENGVTFAGSSAMFSMNRSVGRPKLLHVMGRKDEDVQVWSP
ncbi:carbon-nitrogen hydrolase [Heliocybe sulcata]|uniref:Carbon-nitrogen hydrolase n=1 Tax=Heliocybe sulcata TaxID=5364 RepID=A0A5C3MKB6_9AGAM|nr:carbon-nitrogen hydrolase [Heliocybe sulcata]